MVNPGRLTLNGNTVNVTGTFTTGGGGLLVMQNAADVLNVSGGASFGAAPRPGCSRPAT